ncbi:MAG: HAD superfamily hydrolase (TIGR01509 family) [Gammaproteobacteria bacterium]
MAYINVGALVQISAKYVSSETPKTGAPPWHEIASIVLDMDGTLLDLHFDREVWNRLLPQRYASVSGTSIEAAHDEVARRLGRARGTLQWYSLDHWSERLGIDVPSLESELEHLVQPRPGAIAFLDALQRSELRVILATNAQPSSMRRKLELTGIDRFFDDITCAHNFGACKEESAFWPAFTNELAIDPTTTLFIDDNHSVLEAAQRFGIAHLYGISYPSSQGPGVESDEFQCLSSFDELAFEGNCLALKSNID